MKLFGHAAPIAPKVAWHFPHGLIRVAIALWAVMVCAVFIWLNALWYRQMQMDADLSRYRMAPTDLAGKMRTKRASAVAQQRGLELRVDAGHGVLYLSSAPHGRHAYAQLEQTIWLPAGLQISEAPLAFSAQPNGAFTPASMMLVAPSYRRLFRLTTSINGMVELYEEPTS